jgi:hypothetical protein
MYEFGLYREAVVRWLHEQGNRDFVLVGGEFETFRVTWDDASQAIALDEQAIAEVYAIILEERERPVVTLEDTVSALQDETALMQEVLAFTATRLDELNELDDDLLVLQDVLAFYVGVN